ncbi:MAG TPA: 4Fe-4S binding protein [Polyangiaceae bacterium]
MCEFCTKHGDGRIWFKHAANFGNDLMADLERRKYVAEFLERTMGEGIVTIGRLEAIYQKKGRLPYQLREGFVARAKTDHFGQVVTIEDVEAIVSKAALIVRFPCACKWAANRKESRACYSLSYSADTWFDGLDMSWFGLPQAEGFERVSPRDAVEQMRELGASGAVHSIWTMKTPFIGAICNCEPDTCLGLRTLLLDMRTMHKGESCAMVDESRCSGCGSCASICRFNAIERLQRSGESTAHVNPNTCYGCGNCRLHCPEDAVSMRERNPSEF